MNSRILLALAAAGTVSACGVPQRLANVGKPPKLSAPEAVEAPYVERSIAMQGAPGRAAAGSPYAAVPAQAQPQPQGSSASLFRTGAGALFRDQRASSVGDILTVRVNIADKADIANTTSRSRVGAEQGGIAALLGLQTPLAKILPGSVDTSKLVDTSSNSTNTGSGSSSRNETINMTLAAVVTNVMQNGNLVIRARQEVRVNYELRELVVTGIVRPEDIARDNSIRHSQIADARISYGGRGQLTDAQQARWGQQIYDALFPF